MHRKRNKKSIIVGWLYFFIGLIVFVALLFGVFSYATQKKMKDQAEKSAEYAFGVASENVKYNLSAIVNQYVRMTSSEELKALMETKDIDWFRNEHAAGFLEELVFQNSIDSASVSYVYFSGQGIVFSKNGIFSDERYYDEHFSPALSFEEWKRLHFSTEVIPKEVSYTGETAADCVMVCMPFFEKTAAREADESGVVFAFMLDKNRFFALNKNFKWLYDANFYLTEENGDVLFASGPRYAQRVRNINEAIHFEEKVFYDSEYFYHKTKKIGFHFSVPYASLYPEESRWRWIIVFCFALLLIGVGSALFLFMNVHYRKITKIMKILPANEGGNEWSILEKNLIKTMEENENFSEQQKILETNLRSAVIRQALYIRDYEGYIKEYFRDNKIDIEGSLVSVCLIDADERGRQTFRANLQKILYKISGLISGGYAAALKNNTIVIIYGMEMGDGERVADNLDTLCRAILKEFGIVLKYCCSKPHFISNIPDAYREALYGMETDGGREEGGDVNVLFYSMEDKIEIFDNLCIGNAAGAIKALDRVFLKLSTEKYSSKIISIFSVDMVSLILDVAQRKNINALLETGAFDFNKTYIIGDNVDEIKLSLKRLVEEICSWVSVNEKSTNRQTCEKMFEYIKENYRDPNISTKQLAEIFQLSQSYLSMNFAKIYGESPSYFINRYRIEESVRLLNDPSLTVKKIAEIVGYGHERTFSRNFKKEKNIYPHEYRKML